MVLDASAALALLFDEPGGKAVLDVLDGGVGAMSAVNVAEVAGALRRDGISRAGEIVRELVVQLTVVAFDLTQAELVGELLPLTAPHGLGLGDRACLALAKQRGEPVLTADRAWTKLPSSVGVEIELLR